VIAGGSRGGKETSDDKISKEEGWGFQHASPLNGAKEEVA